MALVSDTEIEAFVDSHPGWAKVDDEFFNDETGKVTEILRSQGAPLE